MFRISVAFFALIQLAYLEDAFQEVTITQGVLRGSLRTTWGGKTFTAFQGIPYAKPPVGKLRFKAPEQAEAWDGVLDASRNHAACPQQEILFNNYTIFGNEDCLYLNVYSPQLVENSLPVIVFIHGGGFMTDSANPSYYGPDILLDKNLILVTINYRLGALGFLSLEDEILPGNYGLKDQSLALHWIKNNIAQFGGDPDKITIFGNSAGGASIYYHLLSPLSKDLLFAGFSSSGISTAHWAIAQKGEAKRNTQRLATFLNCPLTSSEKILDCLTKVDAHDIVRHGEKFMEFIYEPSIPHKPVVEVNAEGAFITEHPIDIIKSGKLANIPFINGITTDEGALKSAAIYNNYALVERLNNNFEKYAPMVLSYDNENYDTEVTRSIRKFYFNDKDIDNNTKAELTDAITDSLFYYPQRITTELHAQYSKQPVYFYLFGYRGSVSTSTYFGDPEHNYGVCHCDDLIYLLSSDLYTDYKANESELKMNDIMTTLLYNFASTGNPTPELNSLFSTKWESVQSNKFQYYSIKGPNEMSMEKNLFEERYNFWKNLPIHSRMFKIKDEL